MERLPIFAMFTGLVMLLAVSVCCLLWAITSIRDLIVTRKFRKYPPFLWQLPGDISLMGRYCEWYFPIIGDIEKWLLESSEGTAPRIEEFREQLWRKYGKRDERSHTSDAPDATTEPKP